EVPYTALDLTWGGMGALVPLNSKSWPSTVAVFRVSGSGRPTHAARLASSASLSAVLVCGVPLQPLGKSAWTSTSVCAFEASAGDAAELVDVVDAVVLVEVVVVLGACVVVGELEFDEHPASTAIAIARMA